MRRNRASISLFVAAAVAFALVIVRAAAADGNPPERMTYQGYLVDGNGVALGDAAPKNYDVIFRIWSDQSSTDTSKKLWSELQTVTVDKGYFSALLGEGTDPGDGLHKALSTVFTNKTDASDRWIQMTVKGIGPNNTDLPILPRLRLLTSPYAFLARNAVNAANLVNSGYNQVVTVSGTAVGINKLSPTTPLDVNGTVTATTFAGSGASLTSLNAGNITSGTLADARLSANVAQLGLNQTFSGKPTFNSGFTVGSSGSAVLTSGGATLRLSDNPIYLRSSSDANHGLVYSNTVDGICLFGYMGGTLNTTYGGAKSVLNWNRFGNVGIGSISPQARLEIQAGADSGGGSDQKAIALAYQNGGYRHWIRSRHNNNATAGNAIDFFLNNSTTEAASSAPGTGNILTLTLENGRVGIATNAPKEKLHVNGSALIEGSLRVKSSNGGGTLITANNNNDNRIYLEGFSNDMSSNATAIHITGRGDGYLPNFVVKASNYWFYGFPSIGAHKSVQWDLTTGQLGYYTSSRRFKENIRPFEADWYRLLSARPVTFTRPGRPDRWEIGFIAEEFDEAGLQPLTQYDPEGRPDGISYEMISLYLLQIAKAQQADLQEKTTRIQALEQSVVELKTLVNALAEKVNGGGQ